jgi:hypothetical protein
MVRTVFIAGIFLFGFNTEIFSQRRDTIVLYQGQVFIGEVKSADLATVNIDDIDMKMLSIKLHKIRILKIKELFKIETVEKKILYGRLNTTTKEGWVDIQTAAGVVTSIPITDIYQLISLDKSFFKRLNGNVSAGLSFTKSSNIGQFNFSAVVEYATRLFNYTLNSSAIGTIDSTGYSRDNENVLFGTQYDLTPTWYLAAGAQYQRNLELSISSRWLGLLGGGNKLFIRKNSRLMATTGITFSLEKSTSDVSSSLLYDIPIIFQYNFYQFSHPDIQINSIQSLYFSLSQAGRFRWDGTTTFSWQLIRYFYLNINPYTNFDNQPPGNGSKFDYGIVVGLSYKF